MFCASGGDLLIAFILGAVVMALLGLAFIELETK
jgi:hypothetical protein